MPEPLDVLCVSDMCVDLILQGNVRPRFGQVEQLVDAYHLEPGGSANIFAAQYAKLSGRSGLIGAVGKDVLGRFLSERLSAMGIDMSGVRERSDLSTGLGVVLVEGSDRAMLTVPGTIDAVSRAELDGASACRHWHIASFFLLARLRAHWPEWLSALRARGVTTSLDTNWDPEERWEGVRELLPLVDVFLPNEQEARAISGQADVALAGQNLTAQGPLVVIKRGHQGALAFQGSSQWEVPSNPIDPGAIADTIGAGDCFDAGFLRAWHAGWKIPDCLKLGVRCGESSLRAAGGYAAQLEEAIA